MVDCSFKCTVKVSNIQQVLKQSKKKDKSHFHSHTLPQSQSQSYSVSHNSPRQCIITVHPPPPSSLISTLPPLYLLSPTPPVTQPLHPVNPFWKETTEQKITSPPLSHTSSLRFVFSCSLLLTPSNTTTSTTSTTSTAAATTGRCLSPSTSSPSISILYLPSLCINYMFQLLPTLPPLSSCFAGM